MPESRAVRLDWSGERLRFLGGGTEPTTPSVIIDGDGQSGPSPMLTLLLAAASCSAADVVVILTKMRVALESLSVAVEGVRRDEEPRRYTDVRFTFRLTGEQLDMQKAEHAVKLSLDKYCSVVHSLATDINVTYGIDVA
ncbi:MAG: OsmC family protein [Gemmatimonadota bacterium]|nr:OsmC family protein [Gemmatimonadota bacterium]